MENLTKKQQVFVKEYIETGNGTQSALKAYDTTDEVTAASIAHENLNKPQIVDAIKSLGEYFTEEDLAKVHLEGLTATKKVFKNNNATGEIETVAEEPDYAVRHKYLDTAYKIKGSYAPEKSINLNLNETSEELIDKSQSFDEWLQQRLSKTSST